MTQTAARRLLTEASAGPQVDSATAPLGARIRALLTTTLATAYGTKAAPDGVASLDSTGKVPAAQLPATTAAKPTVVTLTTGITYWKTAEGVVTVNCTGVAIGSPLATLPTGFRPSSSVTVPLVGYNGSSNIVGTGQVLTSGAINAIAGTSGSNNFQVSYVAA
jgi:hypothetical protein